MERKPQTTDEERTIEKLAGESPAAKSAFEPEEDPSCIRDSTALPFDLDRIFKIPGLIEPAVSILKTLATALDSKHADNDVTATVRALDRLCPPTSSPNAVEIYLWALWSMVLEIARMVPHDAENPGQATLVAILDKLQECAKGNLNLWGAEWRLWRDLPLLGQYMEDSWDDPTVNDVTLTIELARAWRNQNAFAARCLAGGVASWVHYGIEQLRAALEEEATSPGSIVQGCRILAASEWIIQSGQIIFRWAQEEDEEPFPWDTDVTPGTLFKGDPGLSVKRWSFWKVRFDEISKEESLLSDEVRSVARNAVDQMDMVMKGRLSSKDQPRLEDDHRSSADS